MGSGSSPSPASSSESSGDDVDSTPAPYFKYAFRNIYNYALLGGVASASLLTHNLWLAIAGGGAEILWLTFGPDSTVLRKLWFDPVHRQLVEAENERREKLRVAQLDDALLGRVNELTIVQRQIHRLAEENPAMTKELLRGELAKLDRLGSSFIDLALLVQRYKLYLESQSIAQLEKDRHRYEAQCREDAGGEQDPEQRKVAQKNLQLILKRQDKLREIRQFIDKALGQMELIENTFGLLADQIVTMRSPQELSGQLDELSDGVEAVKTTARETDALLEAAGT